MMGEEILLTFAELAAAFIGFAGVAAALGNRRTHASWIMVVKTRLGTMLFTASSAIFVSFLPIILYHANLDALRALQTASITNGIIWGALPFYYFRRQRYIREVGGTSLNPYVMYGFNVVLNPLMAVLLIGNGMEWGMSTSLWPYLASLTVMLLLIVIIFSMQIFATFDDNPAP